MSKKEAAGQQSGRVVRVGAVADLHCARNSQGLIQPLLTQMAPLIDVLLLAGDLTDYGLPEEAQVLVRELSGVKVPMVAVLGNHDFESGQQDEVGKILKGAGITLLDGDACEIQGVGIAGIKGFCGGYGRHTLGAWGEDVVKRFVREAIDEALKLEAALARLRTESRIALLHYSPIQATVADEPVEIFPFMGCSRLEEPLGRYPVTAVFHGHAHRGPEEGKTVQGIPVYNVALPLLRRLRPDKPPCRVIEVRVGTPAPSAVGGVGVTG